MPEFLHNPEPGNDGLEIPYSSGGQGGASAGADVGKFKQETTGLVRSSKCQRGIDPDVFDALLKRRSEIMDTSSSILDVIPELLTNELQYFKIKGEIANPTINDISAAATNLCIEKVNELLSDPNFDRKYGNIWRVPLGVKKNESAPEDFVKIIALGIRTLISPVAKTPLNSRDIIYGFPEATKRFEASINRRISEATHIGPESWEMGQFIFGKNLLALTMFALALHEGCENACIVKEHREKAQRDKGQIVFAGTAGSLEARKLLHAELVEEDFGFKGLGTSILAEILSEKIPYKENGALKPLHQSNKYQDYLSFTKELLSANSEKFPIFEQLSDAPWARAFGIGAIEYGRLYRQITTASRILMSESKAKGAHEVQAIFHIPGAKEFLVEVVSTGLQALSIDKANNAVTLDRYLMQSQLKIRFDNDPAKARAYIITQAGRILLGISTIRECTKYLPEELREMYREAASTVKDLLYTTVSERVNPLLIELGQKPILGKETYSAYQNVIKPLQTKVEEIYGAGVDERVREIIDEALSGQLYVKFVLGMGSKNRLDHRPIH